MSVQTHRGPVRAGLRRSAIRFTVFAYTAWNSKEITSCMAVMDVMPEDYYFYFFQAVNRCPLKYSSTEFELCFGVSIKDRGTGTFQTTPAPQRPPSWHQLLPNTQNIRVFFFLPVPLVGPSPFLSLSSHHSKRILLSLLTVAMVAKPEHVTERKTVRERERERRPVIVGRCTWAQSSRHDERFCLFVSILVVCGCGCGWVWVCTWESCGARSSIHHGVTVATASTC